MALTDTWTGTNGDNWDGTNWPTLTADPSGDATIDIQSNEGRLQAGVSFAPRYAAAVSSMVATNMEGQIKIHPIGAGDTSSRWLYLCVKSSGDVQDGQDGRPADAIYFRFWMGQDTGPDYIYNRQTNVEGSPVHTMSGTTRQAGDPFQFRWKVQDDTPVAGTTRVSYKRWDDGTGSDPGSWTDVDISSPGNNEGSGTFMLVARTINAGWVADARLDDLTVTDLDAPAGGPATSVKIDMINRVFTRVTEE